MLQCFRPIKFDDFDVKACDLNNISLMTKESSLVKHDKPVLNETIKSFPPDFRN